MSQSTITRHGDKQSAAQLLVGAATSVASISPLSTWKYSTRPGVATLIGYMTPPSLLHRPISTLIVVVAVALEVTFVILVAALASSLLGVLTSMAVIGRSRVLGFLPGFLGPVLVIAWLFNWVLAGCGGGSKLPQAQAIGDGAGRHRYEYVFTDGALYVYSLDAAGFPLVKSKSIPTEKGTRGAVACVLVTPPCTLALAEMAAAPATEAYWLTI